MNLAPGSPGDSLPSVLGLFDIAALIFFSPVFFFVFFFFDSQS